MKIATPIAAFVVVSAAAPTLAQPASRILVSNVEPGSAAGMMVVEITILQFQSSSSVDGLPAHFPAQLEIDGNKVAVMLDRLDAPPERPVDRGRFGQAKYALRLPAHGSPTGLAILSLGNEAGSGYAFSLSGVDASRAQDRPRSAENALAPPEPARPQSAKPERGNAFLGNLSSYAPIYAVYGPGTDSDARLQISFKYQLFGEAGATGRGHPFINNIHVAVTQRMFWDLGTESTPFRNIDFMPELFYLLPATAIDRRIALGGQAGLRHESNGRDGLASRSLNTLYLQPVATMSVGKYSLSLGPRLDLYVGRLKDNPDIKRYRGNASLFAEIGQDDGIRLSTNTRFNFATGKGAIDANLSYPLDRLVYSELNLYAFGQAFAGYGENLLDYNRRITRLRVGVGIVR